MESSIFVLDPIKGVFWPFKVDRRIYLTDTVNAYLMFKYLIIHISSDWMWNKMFEQ